jgi:hypothetical protein
MIIDTGSSDLWVKGEDVVGNPVNRIRCSDCVLNNNKIEIAYLDGKLNTYVYESNITLGSHNFK